MRLEHAILVLTAILTLAGCHGAEPGTGSDSGSGFGGRSLESDVDTPPGMARMMRMMGMVLPEGIPADALPNADSRGATLVARYCSRCHGIPSPATHSAEDWIPTLRRMFARMERMSRMGGMMMRMRGPRAGTPDAAERHEIRAYLQANALEAADPAALPPGAGAELFVQTCSRCHALPDPGQHTPGDWPAVVTRMRRNMEMMNVAPITAQEADTITRYLQRTAQQR